MTPVRLPEIAARYAGLRVAVVGDFCLDRYLEIDPARTERSIETGRPVHNVVGVRAQAGAAGTILNNLVALGVGTLHVVGFCGEDGEGFELRRALAALPGVRLEGFRSTPERRTFTYCKPLVLEPGRLPLELDRFDSKNWTPTPRALQEQVAAHLLELAPELDALMLMDQVDAAETGVVTGLVRAAAGEAAGARPGLITLADSRRGLQGFPPLGFKMNAAELAALAGVPPPLAPVEVKRHAAALAVRNGQPVFVTLSEQGIVGATPTGAVEHVPAWPVRGPIDIVGAGDAVSANLLTALAAGATLREAMSLAMAAASIVIHQLGTTGTATVAQIREMWTAHESD
ncbi:MAG: carbohydrate kinase [Verrucomicrobia bacterium]|nr:carbohydrate kinase [Verrucomicrobiota bacterium]